ncbi:MAG TPA: copper resistance CopC family protein [Stellaceae bacterium]|nr:copper resistance CopC family protein [Stellaceae bacterium]
MWSALTPTPAAAHAIVVASDPAVDAVLHGTKFPVMLRFNSRIDQERSRLTLLRADATSEPLPLAPSASPDTLSATLEGMPPGHYRLRWQVLAVDGHITRGDIPFTVAP